MSVEIKEINIRIDGVEIKLTVDQAKELWELLNDTFGKRKIFFQPPTIVPVPYPQPIRPHWEITCDSTAGKVTPTFSLGSD